MSSIDWDFNRHGHQEIMSTLSAWGNRVLLVENTDVRSTTLRDWPRLLHRVRCWLRGIPGREHRSPGDWPDRPGERRHDPGGRQCRWFASALEAALTEGRPGPRGGATRRPG